jgi:DNA-binding response OmpR family regulator
MPARILVCEDSPIEQAALSLFLRQQGYDVATAADGNATVEHIKANPVDAVLLDLRIPKSDGFQVLNYLQEHRRSLPVIVVSGMPLDEIQERMHDLPSHELPPLLLKPFDPDQLVQLLELELSGGLPELKSSDDAAQRSM